MTAHEKQLLERHPIRSVAVGTGVLRYREAGVGVPLVLLHGIGSGSASWVHQLEALSASFRVLAWDCPGYGGSTPPATDTPRAADYAGLLHAWLQALRIDGPFHLLGHSLGALIGSAYVAHHPLRPASFRLVSPARGYGRAAPDVRQARLRDRLAKLHQLGVEAMANDRAPHLCAPGAPRAAVEWVRWNMARLDPHGYALAAHMLAHDDLLDHLPPAGLPLQVWCGEHDGVTPPATCAAVAQGLSAPFTLLPGVGHACYIEDAPAFNRRLLAALES